MDFLLENKTSFYCENQKMSFISQQLSESLRESNTAFSNTVNSISKALSDIAHCMSQTLRLMAHPFNLTTFTLYSKEQICFIPPLQITLI